MYYSLKYIFIYYMSYFSDHGMRKLFYRCRGRTWNPRFLTNWQRKEHFPVVLAQHKVLHQCCISAQPVHSNKSTKLLCVSVCNCHCRTCMLLVRASLAQMRKNSSQFLATGAQSISEEVSVWEVVCASVFECRQVCTLFTVTENHQNNNNY